MRKETIVNIVAIGYLSNPNEMFDQENLYIFFQPKCSNRILFLAMKTHMYAIHIFVHIEIGSFKSFEYLLCNENLNNLHLACRTIR